MDEPSKKDEPMHDVGVQAASEEPSHTSETETSEPPTAVPPGDGHEGEGSEPGDIMTGDEKAAAATDHTTAGGNQPLD